MTADRVKLQDVGDTTGGDRHSGPSHSVATDSASSTEGNAAIKQMRGQNDSTVVGDKFGEVQLTATADSGRSADMKMMQDLYDKAIPDPKRREIFHDRMEAIRTGDPKTFDAMVAVASKIGGKPPLDAAAAGREIAGVVRVASDEIKAKGGGNIDLGGEEMMTILGGLSGLMLAERGTFDPAQRQARTAAMVDAADQVLNPAPGGKPDEAHPHGFMTGNDGRPIPMFVHGVMWADNGEPSLSAYSSNAKYDRHKFEIRL